MNHYNTKLLFKSGIGKDFFGATMSQQWMTFWLVHITFDGKITSKDRWTSDRFAAGREMFNKNCSKCVIPSEYLAIDETLYPMRHQIAFRQQVNQWFTLLFYLQSSSLCRQMGKWWWSLQYMCNGGLSKVLSEWSREICKSQRT